MPYQVTLNGEVVGMQELHGQPKAVVPEFSDALCRVALHAGLLMGKRVMEGDPMAKDIKYPLCAHDEPWPFEEVEPGRRWAIAMWDMHYEIQKVPG